MKRLSLFFGFLIVCFSLSAQVLDVLNEDFDDVSLNLPDGWDNSDNTLSNPMYNCYHDGARYHDRPRRDLAKSDQIGLADPGQNQADH